MPGEVSWPVQVAIVTALRADNALITQLPHGAQSIYDDVDGNADLPYVVVGESSQQDWDTKSTLGQEHDFILHAFSRYKGWKEVSLIRKAIYDVLHNKELTITGGTMVLMRQIFATNVRETDGLTRHTFQRFRILTQ